MNRPPVQILPPGEVLGGCTILGLIGRGSMGAVYRAWQASLSRQVAVKVLHKDRFDQLVTLERFLQEAETAANLHHPNIVSVYSLGDRPDCVFFTMEYLDGPPLGEWLRRRSRHPMVTRRRPSLHEIAEIGRQMLCGLHHAHSEGVVHRDIKPENILWTSREERLVVTDFGLADVNYVSHEVEKQFILGSPLYVSPEQARGDVVDGRADLFSVGCVLLELTLGFLPVKVDRPEKIFRQRAREAPDMFTGMAGDHLPGLHEPWDLFLKRALAPRSSDRFQDARSMLHGIEQAIATLPSSGPP